MLRKFGITLTQLQTAISNSNATVGGDYVDQGEVAMTVRSVGLFGGGTDPTVKVLGLKSPRRKRRPSCGPKNSVACRTSARW